jgi:cbb3-type cytochrome oxidase subunit 3
MSAPLVSLLVVTIGFTVLVAWVYWPSHKTRLERLGRIPLGDDRDQLPVRREDPQP